MLPTAENRKVRHKLHLKTPAGLFLLLVKYANNDNIKGKDNTVKEVEKGTLKTAGALDCSFTEGVIQGSFFNSHQFVSVHIRMQSTKLSLLK